MKKRIEPLYGIHHYGNRNDTDEQSRTAASPLTDEQKAKMPLITHQIARPHPVTGRKSLYAVSGSSFGIVGMPDDEARRPARRARRALDAAEVSATLQVRRRRRRRLGQRVAAAFGDADRSGRRAHAVADHGAGAGAGSAWRRRCSRRRSRTAECSRDHAPSRLIRRAFADTLASARHCKHGAHCSAVAAHASRILVACSSPSCCSACSRGCSCTRSRTSAIARAAASSLQRCRDDIACVDCALLAGGATRCRPIAAALDASPQPQCTRSTSRRAPSPRPPTTRAAPRPRSSESPRVRRRS